MSALPCRHVAPESCPRCDGTARDEREAAGRLTRWDRAQIEREEQLSAIPPCMRPTTTRALIDPTRHVEEAS